MQEEIIDDGTNDEIKSAQVPSGVISFETNDIFPISNDFITSKYNATNIENLILHLAVRYASYQKDEQSSSLRYIARFPISMLFKDNEYPRGGSYTYIKNLVNKMMHDQNPVLVEKVNQETGKKEFISTYFLTSIKYIDGEGSIYAAFEPLFAPEFFKPIRNFTTLSIKMLRNLGNCQSASRLYENLRSKCFHKDKHPVKAGDVFEIIYGLGRLKFTLGLIDMSNPLISPYVKVHAMTEKEEELFEDLVRQIEQEDIENSHKSNYKKQSKYHNTHDFKKRVLLPAINEINTCDTDITVTYTELKRGRTIVGYKFQVTIKYILMDDSIESKIVESKDVDYQALLNECYTFISSDYTKVDVETLLAEAGFEPDYLKEAYEYVCNYKQNVDVTNEIGLIINYLRSNKERYNKNKVAPKQLNIRQEVAYAQLEELMKIYPGSKDNKKLSEKAIMELDKVGWENVKKAMDRYLEEFEYYKSRDREDFHRNYVSAFNFFTDRYKEYLSKEATIRIKKTDKKNKFTEFPQRTDDLDALVLKKIEERYSQMKLPLQDM